MKEKSLIEKLGITTNSKVALIPPRLDGTLASKSKGRIAISATPTGLEKLAGEQLDIILIWIETKENLASLLSDLKNYIKPTGAVWTVIKKKSAYPKGTIQKVNEMDIINAAKKVELVDNKIASISDTEYAFRLVIPLAARGNA